MVDRPACKFARLIKQEIQGQSNNGTDKCASPLFVGFKCVLTSPPLTVAGFACLPRSGITVGNVLGRNNTEYGVLHSLERLKMLYPTARDCDIAVIFQLPLSALFKTLMYFRFSRQVEAVSLH